jgi:SAM-dependent methyltransferase
MTPDMLAPEGHEAWTADTLRVLLPSLDVSIRHRWYDSLEHRKRDERDFHNSSKQSRETDDLPADAYAELHGNKKYYSVVGSSREYLRTWLRTHVPGRVFLDYACGNGDQTIAAARMGAALAIGIDLSDVSIANARREAAAANLSDRCTFIVADCERTGLPAASIDVALCSGMLHHLDLRMAFPELQRILKPGGLALAVESLDYNPLIKLYRRLTPAMRTDWEKRHILGMGDLRFARRFFQVRDVRFWHLFSLLAMVFRTRPRQFETALRVLDRVDEAALRLPLLRLMSWQFTFELAKTND